MPCVRQVKKIADLETDRDRRKHQAKRFEKRNGLLERQNFEIMKGKPGSLSPGFDPGRGQAPTPALGRHQKVLGRTQEALEGLV
jgi:hypothetical protein